MREREREKKKYQLLSLRAPQLQPLPAQVLTAQSSMAATACSSLSLRALRAWRRIRQRIEKLVLLDWEGRIRD
uniref:Uncharacterized protein n=1 Tax=Fagus sylvatica TaxID=28930 RepID=A0A2N9FBD3_FAGSY